MLLISDTNASIKFAAFGKLFFVNKDLIGELATCTKIGGAELQGLSKQNLGEELKKCVKCALDNINYYDFDEYDEYEFWDFDNRYYKEAEESVLAKHSLGGACDNDKYFMHLAVTYGYTLVTNDLPLYFLAGELITINKCEFLEGFNVTTVEDLVIEAYDNGHIDAIQVKSVLKVWEKAKRSVLKMKKPLFQGRGLL
jgi:hypothetical protein